jgi:hypothetical protein
MKIRILCQETKAIDATVIVRDIFNQQHLANENSLQNFSFQICLIFFYFENLWIFENKDFGLNIFSQLSSL